MKRTKRPFWAKPLIYELAESDDKFYIVRFPNKKQIEGVYPQSTYEYKEK